ncbi:MAG TPA: tripartite tricarboxylate transporter TctB family protein [Devosiaceae bacterium]|jgi:hypothetical protein
MALRDPLIGIVVFLLSAGIFLMARQYPADAALFPQLITGIMMLVSLIMIVRGFVRPSRGEPIDREGATRLAVVVGLTIAYVGAVANLGYVTASIFFIPVTAYALGSRRYLTLALTTAIFLGVLVYLFVFVFQVQLPQEAIFQLFPRN